MKVDLMLSPDRRISGASNVEGDAESYGYKLALCQKALNP